MEEITGHHQSYKEGYGWKQHLELHASMFRIAPRKEHNNLVGSSLLVRQPDCGSTLSLTTVDGFEIGAQVIAALWPVQ